MFSTESQRFIEYYDALGHYDTGIFGTDIVTRLLFEYGRADIAVKLLTASEPHGFGKWQRDGATTFWEYWFNSRSHDHPMFGAVTTYLFEYILGIKQKNDSFGFERISISPMYTDSVDFVRGHITTVKGKIAVSYTKTDGKVILDISLPEGVVADITAPDGNIVEVSGSVNMKF
jgi:alpha-L-rhamnosidase